MTASPASLHPGVTLQHPSAEVASSQAGSPLGDILVSVLQKNTTNMIYIYISLIYKEIYFKELAHMSMEAGKSKFCRMGWQPGDPGRANVAVQVQRPYATEFSGSQFFVLFRPSTDWMRPTHITVSNLLYSSSTNFNANLIQKHPSETFRIIFDQVSGHHGPDKLTHKTDHHRWYLFLNDPSPWDVGSCSHPSGP